VALALGYFAGKRKAFDTDQSAGLSKLALNFSLPASLFVSMTEIRKDLLLQQGRASWRSLSRILDFSWLLGFC
jgi:malonate transporter and related proteins